MATNVVCDTNTRYPARVRDVALQEWAFTCGRDPVKTRAALKARQKDEGWPCIPDARTIRGWAARDDWAGEAARMLRSIAPDMASRAITDLILAAMSGAAYIRELATGTQEGRPNSSRSIAAQFAVKAVGLDTLARAELMEATRGIAWAEASSISLPDTSDQDATSPALPSTDRQAAIMAAVLASHESVSPPD